MQRKLQAESSLLSKQPITARKAKVNIPTLKSAITKPKQTNHSAKDVRRHPSHPRKPKSNPPKSKDHTSTRHCKSSPSPDCNSNKHRSKSNNKSPKYASSKKDRVILPLHHLSLILTHMTTTHSRKNTNSSTNRDQTVTLSMMTNTSNNSNQPFNSPPARPLMLPTQARSSHPVQATTMQTSTKV